VLKQDPNALEEEAARLYERVVNEFPFVPNNDTRTERPQSVLGQMATVSRVVAKVHLDELRRLSVGKAAPEILGVDLNDTPLKLSDFRGKVVVLYIPGFDRPVAAPPERHPAQTIETFRRLARTLDGKPVVFLGVAATNRDGFKKEVEASGLAIRFWWDPEQENPPGPGVVAGPRPGPILTDWDAEIPNWYVIDARGVIRYTHMYGSVLLEKAVTTLLKEQGN
jgi:peroxiredoxin